MRLLSLRPLSLPLLLARPLQALTRASAPASPWLLLRTVLLASLVIAAAGQDNCGAEDLCAVCVRALALSSHPAHVPAQILLHIFLNIQRSK
jgi:hypothetical protein